MVSQITLLMDVAYRSLCDKLIRMTGRSQRECAAALHVNHWMLGKAKKALDKAEAGWADELDLSQYGLA